jgi:hypothetical protein
MSRSASLFATFSLVVSDKICCFLGEAGISGQGFLYLRKIKRIMKAETVFKIIKRGARVIAPSGC